MTEIVVFKSSAEQQTQAGFFSNSQGLHLLTHTGNHIAYVCHRIHYPYKSCLIRTTVWHFQILIQW